MNMIFCCKWFPIDLKIAWHSNISYPKTYTIELFCWTSTWKVRNCGIVASIWKRPQKSHKNGFKIWKLIWVNELPSIWWGWHLVIWRWFQWRLNQKTNPNLISKLLPPQDHHWHSYYDFLRKKTSTCQIWAIGSYLYPKNINTDGFFLKPQDPQPQSLKLKSHFWANLREYLACGHLF